LPRYERSLDQLIIDVLCDGTQSYRQLKRQLEFYAKTGKKISFDTYNRHIRSLVANGHLKRKEIGNKVFFSLEENIQS
jgi:DNA-binding HxlR family transcriptional regulator